MAKKTLDINTLTQVSQSAEMQENTKEKKYKEQIVRTSIILSISEYNEMKEYCRREEESMNSLVRKLLKKEGVISKE
ncbi:hypothetical protein [Campylobacter sp. US33a]|uniref:hypothetical protein n=1 Tax=Campylobacter sp. US33a TaxID=2498120 RepID=UPI0010681711|nr:hypothetical protein [Campylobacter sp. US33a]TEX99677.1 hypothetical protein ELQ16_09655 [Campylobacter sp. US33a]